MPARQEMSLREISQSLRFKMEATGGWKEGLPNGEAPEINIMQEFRFRGLDYASYYAHDQVKKHNEQSEKDWAEIEELIEGSKLEMLQAEYKEMSKWYDAAVKRAQDLEEAQEQAINMEVGHCINILYQDLKAQMEEENAHHLNVMTKHYQDIIQHLQPKPPRVYTDLSQIRLGRVFRELQREGQLTPMQGYKPKYAGAGRALHLYCYYHQCHGHHTDKCNNLRDKVQDLIDEGILEIIGDGIGLRVKK